MILQTDLNYFAILLIFCVMQNSNLAHVSQIFSDQSVPSHLKLSHGITVCDGSCGSRVAVRPACAHHYIPVSRFTPSTKHQSSDCDITMLSPCSSDFFAFGFHPLEAMILLSGVYNRIALL